MSTTDDFLDEFVAATGLSRPREAFACADTPARADQLAALVVAGRKRATAGLLADVHAADEPLPRPGDLAVVLNASGNPVCVVRTSSVEVVPFREVGAEFAQAEGEDDGSLASWRAEHERFFRRRCAQLGVGYSDDLEVVCERFELVWPPAPKPTRPVLGFRDQPVIEGRAMRLRPFRADDLDVLWGMVNDPEGARLTGTHTRFTRDQIDAWYGSRGEDAGRLDLAIATLDDDRCVGEVVLGGLDADNASCWFRGGLVGPEVYGRGYGTEATRLLLAHAFDSVGLHRIELEVYAFNHRARHVYEKLGFRVEGIRRDALYWDGVHHDATLMGLLAHEWRAAGTSPP